MNWGEGNSKEQFDRSAIRSIYATCIGDDYLGDFFVPALSEAIHYRRVIGDFSASFLAAAAAGLAPFFLENGTMKLITNGSFSTDDAEAIKRGTDPNFIIEKNFLQKLSDLEELLGVLEREWLEALTLLLKSGRLEMKVSVLTDSNNEPVPVATAPGIAHTKIGIIDIVTGDKVGFLGGLNESMRAYKHNLEALQVSRSWNPEELNVIRQLENIFDRLWTNTAVNTQVYEFPEACKRELIRIFSRSSTSVVPSASTSSLTQLPLWEHQRRAVDEFLDRRRGILEMATGSGKTRTALEIMLRLTASKLVDSVIVTVDGNDLLDQWTEEVLQCNAECEQDYRVLRHYGAYHQRDEFLYQPESSFLVCSRRALAPLLSRLPDNAKRTLLLIHDEVHGLGSPACVRDLSGTEDHIPFRLGLSATPEREYDQSGNEFIEQHIGPVIFQFELADAIREGILCEFDYVPLDYQLSDDDRQALRSVYQQEAARRNTDNPMSEKEKWMALAKVYKKSLEKLPAFEEYLRSNPSLLSRCIVFVEEQEYGEKVLPIVHRYSDHFHTYYDYDNKSVLMEFASGHLDSLITCHKISQGIDIRSLNTVILFSSNRGRLETIQRIGRCLRIDPSRPEKRALVVDFIRVPDENDTTNSDIERREWLTQLSQVRRVHDGIRR